MNAGQHHEAIYRAVVDRLVRVARPPDGEPSRFLAPGGTVEQWARAAGVAPGGAGEEVANMPPLPPEAAEAWEQLTLSGLQRLASMRLVRRPQLNQWITEVRDGRR